MSRARTSRKRTAIRRELLLLTQGKCGQTSIEAPRPWPFFETTNGKVKQLTRGQFAKEKELQQAQTERSWAGGDLT